MSDNLEMDDLFSHLLIQSKTKEEFSFKFSGIKGKDNVIEAELLAETIKSLSVIVKETAKILDKKSNPVLQVTSHKQGSFEICFEVINDIVAIQQGLSGITGVTELIINIWEFLQFLQGKKPKNLEKQKDSDNYLVTNDKDETKEVSQQVIDSVANDTITNNVGNLYNNCTFNNCTLKTDIQNKNTDKKVTIKKSEFDNMTKKDLMTNFSQTNQEEIEERIIEDKVKRALLLEGAHFVKHNKKWDFILDDDTKNNLNISAKIQDKEFLKKVSNGEITLSAGTKLYCELFITTKIVPNKKSKETYIVEKVIKITTPEEQMGSKLI